MPNPWLSHILTVVAPDMRIDENRDAAVMKCGVSISRLSPTLLSAFTAMSIASETNKEKIDVVHVHRIKDATAAVSARKISKNPNFKIVMELGPNTPVPRNITTELFREIDGWICASDKQSSILRHNSNLTLTIQEKNPEQAETFLQVDSLQKQPIKLVWIGLIDKNVDRLKQAIDCVDQSEGKIQLTVGTTGKARYAMQAVQKSRAMKNPELIQWAGDDCDIDSIVASCDGIVQAQADAQIEELDSCQNVPLFEPTSKGFVLSPIKVKNAESRATQIIDFYKSI